MDPGTQQAVWIPDPARAWSSLQLLLTGDGSSILASDRHGRLLRISRDGVVHTLSGDESIVLFEGAVGDDFFQFTGHRFASDSVRCSGTQQILSARCDGSEITLWLDGAASRSIPLPRDLHWRSDDGIRQRSIFRAGPGGVLLLSHLASPSSQEVDSFAIFDPARNAWRRIPDAARGSTDRLIALGESSPRFAVLDADRNIRIYHHAAARPETCCAANLPYDSVQWLTFVLDDQYLLAGTRDGQMVVYAVADGAEVFRCRLTESRTNAAADFSVWHDPGNNRIYVRGGSHVRCFDAATWTELIHFDEKDGALLFSPVFQQICLRRTELPSRALRLYMLPVPTTAELVSTAQQLMQ